MSCDIMKQLNDSSRKWFGTQFVNEWITKRFHITFFNHTLDKFDKVIFSIYDILYQCKLSYNEYTSLIEIWPKAIFRSNPPNMLCTYEKCTHKTDEMQQNDNKSP